MILKSIILWCVIMICGVSLCRSQEPEDSLAIMLDELEVRQQGKHPIKRLDADKIRINSQDITKLNRKFGESDIISVLLSTSGVNKSSDYGSGLSVEGASPAQTQYLIDGFPIIFPYRFGGIFSTFNSSHFTGATFDRHVQADRFPGLGGVVDFIPYTSFKDKPSGDVNVGLLSSSVTVKIPLERKISIAASGRISYVDQIYGSFLKNEDNFIRYKFYDLNLTATYDAGQRGEFVLNAYQNSDKIKYLDDNYSLNINLDWRNTLIGLSWRKEGKNNLTAGIFGSCFSNKLLIDMNQAQMEAPSSLKMAGGRFEMEFGKSKDKIKHFAGANLLLINTTPQWATLNYVGTHSEDSYGRQSIKRVMQGHNINVYEKMDVCLLPNILTLNTSLRIGMVMWNNDMHNTYTHITIDPTVSMTYHSVIGTVTGSAITSSQSIHTVGFSELGLASDFYLGSCKELPIERCLTLSLNWFRTLPVIPVTAEINTYYSKVWNQTENEGYILGIADEDYNPISNVKVANGYNYGFSLSLKKQFGNVTGKIGYEYGGGRRHGKENKNIWWRSLYDMGSVVKSNVSWQIDKHWNLMCDYSYASGRVYTPVRSLYMIGGNIAMEYGKRNSSRLPDYQRLDIGASYSFQSGGKHPMTHLVNLSIINAYGHKNTEMQYFVIDSFEGRYIMKRLYSLYRFLPSISYSIKF